MQNETTLPAELAAKLRTDILREKIAPASRLTELFVCECYAVSRTPVREALRILESEQLIELIPNRGAVVIGLSKGDTSDLYKLREILEIQAVRWAAERVYQDELEELERSLEFMEYYTRRKEAARMRELGGNFHHNIRQAAHNRQLAEKLARCRLYLSESAHTKTITSADLTEIHKEHARIFDCIAAGDSEAGAAAMALHIAHARLRAGL